MDFPELLRNSERKIHKVRIFLLGNKISRQKNLAFPPRMSPEMIEQAVLHTFFDKLAPRVYVRRILKYNK